MNARQVRARRRRERQKQKKKSFRSNKSILQNSDLSKSPESPQSPPSLLNKRVKFDHFTFDSTGGVIPLPLTGTIIKISLDHEDINILTILLDPRHLKSCNKRTESLLGSDGGAGLIEAPASSLLNFEIIN
jgi:hypothetical protein